VDTSLAEPEDRGHAWIDGFAILMAVAIVSLVSAWSDYKKEGQFLKPQLIAESTKIVTIRRDQGREETMHKENIKVGDIIKIKNGMDIPVDGVVLEASGVLSDESALTGESDHLPKETVDKCMQRKSEHEEVNEKRNEYGPHDVPSPVLLSGT
jgi:P-type E1-E2 ATPase